MTGTVRERTQEIEDAVLSLYAVRSSATAGRARPEPEEDLRTPFQRDRDRIIHTKSFRRLKGKTQVFISPDASDHLRTRLTHTLEVSQIARTVGRALRLNEDLIEAIALGHDLGHTPFGHAGEEVLNRVVPGGFHHSTQSLRVVDILEHGGAGLNLTREVRDGIRWHSKGLAPLAEARDAKPKLSLEAEVVALCDAVAYTNHDMDDAIRSGMVKGSEIPQEAVGVLGRGYSVRLNTMVNDIVKSSMDGPEIRMSAGVEAALEILRNFLKVRMYKQESVLQAFDRARFVLESLYRGYVEHPETLPPDMPSGGSPERRACDHCAGMTDQYALRQFDKALPPLPSGDEEWADGLETEK